jgi:hemerythrin-like domain-containing protein
MKNSTDPRSTSTPTDPDLVDVRDMIVVHTALLREFRLAPGVVQHVDPGDRRRARLVEQHLDLLCSLMHHHHQGEDDLLWPVLGPRLSPSGNAQLAVAEAQHAGIEQALDRVARARQSWAVAVDESSRDALVDALVALHGLLAEHLAFEEQNLLPLVAADLSEAEWQAVGEAGAKSVPKSRMMLVLGMFAYEGDPEVLAAMLAAAPPPVRLLVPRVAPRVYARYAARIHGTRTP